jgi:plasmid segregation protein ParM
MNIGIDVGYSAVKAISENGQRVYFPSIMALSREDPIKGIFNNKIEHMVNIRSGSMAGERLIGEAALQSLSAVSTMARKKPEDIHDLFILSAAYLLGAGVIAPAQNPDKVTLGIGLPLAYYKKQKEEVKSRLESLAVNLSVDNGLEKYVSFSSVKVYPQGLGMLSGLQLPAQGYIGLIDIGCSTTDFLLFKMINGDPIPVTEACGSIEAGVHLVQSEIEAAFQSKTGAPLVHFMSREVMQTAANKGTTQFQGDKIDLTKSYEIACKNTARQIIEEIQSNWSNMTGFLTLTVFAGGGAEFFNPHLTDTFPNSVIVPDPVFANAEGFLKLMGGATA